MAELPPDIMSMLSRGGNLPDEDEFEDFMDQVNQVERLVKGMADGNIDAKAGDEKTTKLIEKQQQLEQARALKKEADARAAAAAAKKKIEDDHRSKWGFYGMWCVRCRAEKQIDAKTCDKCKSDLIDPDTRQKQLLARVEEVKAERIARDIARDRWKRWKASKQYIRYGHTAEHYGKWDYFDDSDDENEELPPPPPPDSAEFKAMEKDIDERAKNRLERRAGADKLQVEGNAAFKQGDLKKALHLYSDGIDMCKDHKQLRTNRALVCNKLGRYPEAIEDCTKVLDICELFEGNSGPGVKDARLKSLSRRATAYKGMGQLAEAVADAELALSLDPSNKEIETQLRGLRTDLRDADTAKSLQQQLQQPAQVAAAHASADENVSPLGPLPETNAPVSDAKPLTLQSLSASSTFSSNPEVAESKSSVLHASATAAAPAAASAPAASLSTPIDHRLVSANSLLQQLRPLLVPYTIKATAAAPSATEAGVAVDDAADQQQQQKTEAANTLLITQLLEQLVSLQDLDEALILVRSHRVLHQLMAVAIARGFHMPFSLMGMKVLCVALNSEANARDACDYKQGRFVSAVLSQLPPLPAVAASALSDDVDDLSFCVAILCEQLTQYECARVPFAPAAVQLLQYAAVYAGVPASPSSASAAAMMTELPRRSMQSLKASAALIASVANVAYTPQGKEALAQGQWVSKEGGAVALIAPLLLFDPPGVALREGASRALVNMSGHDKLSQPMKEDVFLCLCAASLQEFLVRAGDTKKTAGADGGGLLGCAKVCDNVLSAVSNAALDDAFAAAVLGKKAGAIHEKICAIVQSISPVQQQQKSDDAVLPVLAAIAEHSVLALSRLLKSAAAAAPPVPLLSAATLASLVHVVAGGVGGLSLSVIGAQRGAGFARSSGLLDAGVRCLAQGVSTSPSVAAFMQGSREGQEAMVKLLQPGVPDVVVGNACVVIMQLANDAAHVACLQTFGRLGAIAALLDVIKRVRGAAQKNAAIAVARLAKEPTNGVIMQALHGVEIIGSYLHK